MDLDLKDVISCQHCRYECYEEDVKEGVCPRCQKAFFGEEDEEEDEEEEAEARPKKKKAAIRKGPAARKASGAGPARKGPQAKAAPPPAAASKKVVLDERFKAQVFAAFRKADAGTAQQLCLDLVGGNEEHARKIYDYLLEIAKKKNWVGIDAGPAPAAAAPAAAAAAEDCFQTMPLPPDPGGALPLPPGLLGPGAGALPLPPGILPMPAGILAPMGTSPQSFSASDPTIQLQPGQVAAAQAAAPQFSPSDATIQLPAGSTNPSSGSHRALGATPAGGTPAQQLSPATPRPSAQPQQRPAASTPQPPAARPTPAPPPKPADADPEERGFLGRVAVDGRAAQVSLLCLAGHYAAARDLAQSTLARDPFSARGHAAHGEALAGLGQDAQALQAYSSAVRSDPNDAVAIRGYAQVLARLGRHAEAVAAYRRIVGPGKGEARDMVALAGALRKVGDAAGAQRVQDELLKRDPQSLEPVRQQAEGLLAQGNVDGAAQLLERILQKETAPFALALTLAGSLVIKAQGSARALLACARAFVVAGKPLLTVRLLTPHVARDAQNVELRRVLGMAYARLGAGSLAEEHLSVVVSRGAAGLEELLALGEVFLERGDADRGIKVLQQAATARPDDVSVRRVLARAMAAQGDLEGALRELRAAQQGATDTQAFEDELDRITLRAFAKRVRAIEERLQANEHDAAARLDLAEALAQRGDLGDAIAHIDRAGAEEGFVDAAVALAEKLLEDAEARRPLVLLIARMHERAQNPEEAVAVLQGFLKGAPDDPELRIVLYRCYAALERTQDSVVGLQALLGDAPPPHLEEAVKLAEELLARQGYQGLAVPAARARRRLGQVDAAVAHYERHLVSDPDDAEARRELAQVLESAGRVEQAYEVLKGTQQEGSGTTSELERLAGLALAAGKVTHAVELLKRCVDRHPEDLALKRALEAAEARERDDQIRALRGATKEDERLRLAALCAEAGRVDQALEVLRSLGKLGDNPELSYLRFSAEHFARAGKVPKAEAAMRAVARTLGYAPGSDPHKQVLHRIAGLYEHGGDRRAARRVLLELHALDPRYQDIEAKLEALSDDVQVQSAGAPDERLLELVDVGAPLGTIFDALQAHDLAIDPRVLETFRATETPAQDGAAPPPAAAPT